MTTSANTDRIASGLLTAVMIALLGWALLLGLRFSPALPGSDALAVFEVVPPQAPPPPRIIPARHHQHRKSGKASPPNIRSTATEVVAPPPVVVPPTPPPVVVAPVANTGAQATQGAALRPGPGFGAGGQGNGFGSGGDGDGDGDGSDYDTPPRRIRDQLKRGDFPQAAWEQGLSGTVGVRFAVETDGHVTHCVMTRSSGHAILDAATCPAIEKRYRYRPALDEDRRPVRSIVVMDFDWITDIDPPAPR